MSLRHALVWIALGCAAPTLSAQGGWWGDLLQEEVIALERVMSNPEGFRGARVNFPIQFHRFGTIDNPFHTRYDKNWYVNFSGWPDGAALWDRDTYKKDFPYLFIKRSREDAKVIAGAATYSRWLVHGEVTDVVQGKPWIEVRALQRLEKKLDEPTLVQLVKGKKLWDLNQKDGAVQAFRAADHEELPAWVRVFAIEAEARGLLSLGKPIEAKARVDLGLKLIPKEAALQALQREIEAVTKPEEPKATGGQ